MKKQDKPKIIYIIFSVLFLLSAGAAPLAADYSAPIEYRSTLTKILDEADFLQGESALGSGINDFVISADSTKIAFVMGFSSRSDLYVMNREGSNMTLINGSTGWPNASNASTLEINQYGSRVFFIAQEDTPGDDIYYYDTATGACTYAFDADTPNSRKKYAINNAGTRIFLRHQTDGGDETQKGLFYADVGGAPIQILNYGQLPCDQTPNCGIWYNNLYFGAVSGNGNKAIFIWDRKDGSGTSTAMWQTDMSGNFSRTPDESNNYVWGQANPKFLPMVTDDGTRALYVAGGGGISEEISVVDLSTNQKTLLAQDDFIDYATISPDGTRARFLGHYFKHTVYNVTTGAMRDTIPSNIPVVGSGDTIRVSALTANNRFFLAVLYQYSDHLSKIVLVDMNPTDFSQAPNISKISFSHPYLYHDGATEIRAYAHVSDAQGLGTIEWVKMQMLVEGREGINYSMEDPSWSNLGPGSFLGSLTLFDDGTNGDQTAGDSIYTSLPFHTRPSDQSGFFQKYTLPKNVAIRIVARDADNNYSIADATLRVTDRHGSWTPAIVHTLLLSE